MSSVNKRTLEEERQSFREFINMMKIRVQEDHPGNARWYNSNIGVYFRGMIRRSLREIGITNTMIT